MKPIGYFKSNQKKNYEVTRQAKKIDTTSSQVIDASSVGIIELESGFNFEQALQGLETFSHLWVIFVFHKNTHWNTMVSPPRPPLGGPQKLGVFATRSPHRPNFIGQSALQLLKIEGRKIFVLGADLIDGTPILDLKPYVTYADSIQDATQGWLANVPAPFSIENSNLIQSQFKFLEDLGLIYFSQFVTEQLEYNPTQNNSKRIKKHVESESYELAYKTWRVDFKIDFNQKKILLLKIRSCYSLSELANEHNDADDIEIHKKFNSMTF